MQKSVKNDKLKYTYMYTCGCVCVCSVCTCMRVCVCGIYLRFGGGKGEVDEVGCTEGDNIILCRKVLKMIN